MVALGVVGPVCPDENSTRKWRQGMGHLTHRNKNHIKTRGAPRTVYYHLPLAHHQISIGYHSGSRHEFRHEMGDGSVRIQWNTDNQQEMREIESIIHDVLWTQKHKALSSHFNQESCREHNRFDQREIFKERNGRRRREGVCDNTDDAHAKRTLAYGLNKRF